MGSFLLDSDSIGFHLGSVPIAEPNEVRLRRETCDEKKRGACEGSVGEGNARIVCPPSGVARWGRVGKDIPKRPKEVKRQGNQRKRKRERDAMEHTSDVMEVKRPKVGCHPTPNGR